MKLLPFKIKKRKQAVMKPDGYQHKIYANCLQLSFFNWMQINVTGDLKYLVRPGETVSENDLLEAWDIIVSEYQDITNDVQVSAILQLKKEISVTATRLMIIESVVNKLAKKRVDELIKFLQNEMGFYSLSYENLEVDLRRTISMSKSDLVKLKINEVAYKKALEQTKSTQATHQDFIEQLSELAKFQNVPVIKPESISVAEYCALINRFKAFHKPQKYQHHA